MRHGCPGVEERGRSVCKVSLREEVVGLDDLVDVVSVNAAGHAHEHELRALGDLSVHLEKVGLLERLEAEEVVLKVACVHDGLVEALLVLLHNVVEFLRDERRVRACLGVSVAVEHLDELGEGRDGALVEVGDGDARGQDGVVGVLRGHGGGDLRGELIELRGGDAGVDALDDLLRDDYGVDVLQRRGDETEQVRNVPLTVY